MSTKNLYEATINLMKDLLQDSINNSSSAYDVIFNDSSSQPLFSITSRELALLKWVERFSNYQIRNVLAQLCKQLAIEFGHQVTDCTESSQVDFYELCDGEKIGYYISMKEMDMPDLDKAVSAGLTKRIVVVAKSNLMDLPNKSLKYRAYPYQDLTHCITLEKFFNDLSPGEFEIFKEYIGRFNYDAELMLGLVVSPIPTQKAIQATREKIIAKFDDFFYKTAFPCDFTSDELDFLKERFQRSGIFQITSAPFIDSFISSEWYFDLRTSTDGEMEQTAIVAGYLKSIEQFLFTLMLSKCDTHKFTLKSKKDKKHNWVVLTKNNKSSLLTMANNLLGSIDFNYGKTLHEIYINETIGNTVQTFLHDFFENTRNGYFHKDNIYNFDQIKDIRKRAYCAFFLLGSTFLFNIDDLKSAID